MIEKFDQIREKHKALELRLSDPNLIKDRKKFEQTAREHKEISRIVVVFEEWRTCNESLEDARLLLDDSDVEMRNLAKEEVEEFEPKLEEIELRLRRMMLPKDANDDKNVIIEVRAGTG
ncbi:MAG: PCRF domain-containing protein, partial [Nitrospinaceae bacterium]|nr:PCRF domain-containing protein [Nitrospinaceae bacterium]